MKKPLCKLSSRRDLANRVGRGGKVAWGSRRRRHLRDFGGFPPRKRNDNPPRILEHAAKRESAIRHGFTLIELLVVVAIISLLVSILLPSLSRAKDLAKAAVCASNLRQVGVIWVLYWNENNEYIPPMQDWWNWGGTPGPEGQWWPLPNLLSPDQRPIHYIDGAHWAYTDVRDVFFCPNDNVDGICWNIPNPTWWHLGTSYANNPYLVNHPNVPRFLAGIAEPSRLIFIGDTTMFQAVHYPNWVPDITWHDFSGGLQSNILFFDSHVAPTSIWTFPSPDGTYRWFPGEPW